MDCVPHPTSPVSMGFSRKEYWSGLPFPPPGNLPDPGIKPMPPALVGFPGDSAGKESACGGGDRVRFLGREDLLEKG